MTLGEFIDKLSHVPWDTEITWLFNVDGEELEVYEIDYEPGADFELIVVLG